MIIDFHTHVFPEDIAKATIEKLEVIGGSKAFTDGTVNGLINSMKKSDVACSVILPVVTRPKQFRSVNEYAVKINEKYSDNTYTRLISFGGIHPESPDYRAELKEIASMGLKGIKLHPDYQGMLFDDIRYKRIIDVASELGLIISVHAGIDVGFRNNVHCTAKMARNVIDEVRPEKLILAHFGGFESWDDVEKYLVGQKVYFDTAFVNNVIMPEQFIRILEKHGDDKVLFATDSPWSSQKESIDWIEDLKLSTETTERILYKNAVELLGS